MAVLALAGCGGSKGGSSPDRAAGGSAAEPEVAPAQVTIRPARGRVVKRPDRGITVRARGGTLTEVTVRSGGEPVPGTLNAKRRRCGARTWALGVSRRYRVTATAEGAVRRRRSRSGARSAR